MAHHPLVIAASGSMVVLSRPQFTLAQSANRIHEPIGDALAKITLNWADGSWTHGPFAFKLRLTTTMSLRTQQDKRRSRT